MSEDRGNYREPKIAVVSPGQVLRQETVAKYVEYVSLSKWDAQNLNVVITEGGADFYMLVPPSWDFLMPESLEVLTNSILNRPYQVAYSDFEVHDKQMGVIKQFFPTINKQLIEKDFCIHTPFLMCASNSPIFKDGENMIWEALKLLALNTNVKHVPVHLFVSIPC